MARFLAHLVFALYLTSALGQITFTGDAAHDFDLPADTPQDRRRVTLKSVENTVTLGGSTLMIAKGWKSGFDLRTLYVQYDWVADELYGAFDCWVICGDADGDGNPSVWFSNATHPKSGRDDYHLQTESEWTAMGIWTNPGDYQPTESFDGYMPDIGVGDSKIGGLAAYTDDFGNTHPPFGSWRVKPEDWCPPGTDNCESTRENSFRKFGEKFEVPIPVTSRGPLAAAYGLRPVQDVVLAKFPNTTWPDIEFRVKNFSQYGNFNFRPGIDNIKFAFHTSMGSLQDASGEDASYPQILEIPCLIKDECGTCNGNNSACADCSGVPHGTKVIDDCGNCVQNIPSEFRYRDVCNECVLIANYNQSVDACGVCHGGNRSCSDCAGVAHGDAVYDDCGVCGGLNKAIDACGVCFGDNHTCADCAGVPNGDAVYDECGVCDGFNLDKDACGVCFGDNHTCSDCAGVPHGDAVYDDCGVCDGHNSNKDACGDCFGDDSRCSDCFSIPHGTAVYDECGVCDGKNDTCADCHGVPNGGAVYDVCNVCGGLNNTCDDCAGVPAGAHFLDNCGRCVLVESGEVLDVCGVCGGSNDTCTDCAGKQWILGENAHIDGCNNCILFGEPNTAVDDCGRCLGNNEDKDVCGVCFGLNDTCYGCDMVPASGLVYDNCGVCGGDNTTCDCFIYTNVTIGAADTWIDLRDRTKNHGRDVDLWVSSDKQRSLLRFDDIRFKINGATEQRPEILNATLKLFVRGEVVLGDYGMGFKESGKVAVHVLDNNFCEDKATWECRDYDSTGCCTQWRMLALYPKVKADYEFTETASIDLKQIEGHRGWITFDVTEDIKDFMNNGFLNSRSYLVKKDCETDWGWIKFWSCDTPGQMNCPNLEINLKSRCFPVPVIPEPEPEVC